jgi:hypothetical protein
MVGVASMKKLLISIGSIIFIVTPVMLAESPVLAQSQDENIFETGVPIVIGQITPKKSAGSSKPKSTTVNTEETIETLNRLVGKWVFDVDFSGEYLRKGAELQKRWCGHGWTESEIARREKNVRNDAIQNGPPVTYDFREISIGSLEVKMLNNRNESKVKVISSCEKQSGNTFSCKDSLSSEQRFVFRTDGEFLFIMVRLTPDMMNCDLKSTSPKEVWIDVMRLKKAGK